jgi:hypothetical protein
VILAEVCDQAEVDRLAEESWERLDQDDIYGDLAAKPVSEIIAMVCKDLGLAPDWATLAEEAWAKEEIDSGAAGSPLMTLRWLDPPQTAPAGLSPRAPRAASP